jgi:hypothetical protein
MPPSTETEDLDVEVREEAIVSASRKAVAAGSGQSPSAT